MDENIAAHRGGSVVRDNDSSAPWSQSQAPAVVPVSASPEYPEVVGGRVPETDVTSDEDEDENTSAGASASRVKALNFEDLSQHFHLPINAAAKELGICVTVLKKKCRKYGVARWPHRKIKSLDRLVEKLEREEATAIDKEYYRNELDGLRQRKDHMLRTETSPANPTVPLVTPTSPKYTEQPDQRALFGIQEAHEAPGASTSNLGSQNYQFPSGYMPYPSVDAGAMQMYPQQLYFVPQNSQHVVRQGQYYPSVQPQAFPGHKVSGIQPPNNFHPAQMVPVPVPMAMQMHYPFYQGNSSQAFAQGLTSHQQPQQQPSQQQQLLQQQQPHLFTSGVTESPQVSQPPEGRTWTPGQDISYGVAASEGNPTSKDVDVGSSVGGDGTSSTPTVPTIQPGNFKTASKEDTLAREPASRANPVTAPSRSNSKPSKRRAVSIDPSVTELKDQDQNVRWTRDGSVDTVNETTKRPKAKSLNGEGGTGAAPSQQALNEKLNSMGSASANWENLETKSSADKTVPSSTGPPSPPGGSGSGSRSGSGEELGGSRNTGPDASVFQSLNLTVWTTDMSLRVLNCSGDSSCTGYHGSQFTVGTTIPDVVSGNKQSQLLCKPYLEAQKGQESERIYTAADGKRYIQFFKPLREKDEIVGATGICLDITNSSIYV